MSASVSKTIIEDDEKELHLKYAKPSGNGAFGGAMDFFVNLFDSILSSEYNSILNESFIGRLMGSQLNGARDADKRVCFDLKVTPAGG